MDDVIQLAKEAAAQLPSPPRIYATSHSSVDLWPDRPGSVETTYETGGMPLPDEGTDAGNPITLTTTAKPDILPDTYQISFQASWIKAKIEKSHAWRFLVNRGNQQVNLMGESGDDLPPPPL